MIGRNSSLSSRQGRPHQAIAEELGVGFVVEGSVRKSGNRVRFTVQLNDVASRSIAYRDCRAFRVAGSNVQ